MRPRNQIARERLEAVMARRGPLGASELAKDLGISSQTLRRMLKEQADVLVVAGQARRTRYAWRRDLRGDLAPLPLYAIDQEGRVTEQGPLSLIYPPEGTHGELDAAVWPIPPESADGWWEGMPYPLHDMRPQGYMGRQFARAHHRTLRLAESPQNWSDSDVLWALSQHGADLGGNLIVGHVAFEQCQQGLLNAPQPINEAHVGARYAELAEQAIAHGVAGSSAAGEFPKFTALREQADALTPHVIVKFSGADGSAAVQRWSDLLVCEHLALEAMRQLPGVAVARSRIVQHAGRTFIESERFDRHGMSGRSPLVSLGALDSALLSSVQHDWPVLAQRLAHLGLLSAQQVQQVALMWWFGRLIGNTDMHTGNLSFVPQGTLAIAPAYDMLPMMYAPLAGGEVPARVFEPPLPRPNEKAAWMQAHEAAQLFWQRVQADERISDAFKQLALQHQQRLLAVASAV